MSTFLHGLHKKTADRALFRPALVEIARRQGLDADALTLFPRGSNVVAAVGQRVIKLFLPPCRSQHDIESRFLPRFFGRLPVAVPEVIASGEIEGWAYLVLERLPGVPLEDVWSRLPALSRAALMSELGAIVSAAHQIPLGDLASAESEWAEFLSAQRRAATARHRRQGLSGPLLEDIELFLEFAWPYISAPARSVLLTGEYTPPNILLEETSGRWRISGVIDFGDCRVGPADYDLLGPTTFSTAGDPQLLRAFLEGYGRRVEGLDDAHRWRLMGLLLLHAFSDLDVQIQLEGWDRAPNLRALAARIWSL